MEWGAAIKALPVDVRSRLQETRQDLAEATPCPQVKGGRSVLHGNINAGLGIAEAVHNLQQSSLHSQQKR